MDTTTLSPTLVLLTFAFATLIGVFSAQYFSRRISNSPSSSSPPSSPPAPHLHRIGLAPSAVSNIEDEFSNEYCVRSTSSPSSPPAAAVVKSLFIYPIKSCRGIELSTADVLRTGFRHDRIFTFALEKRGEAGWEFITQRVYPKLVKVGVEVWVAKEGEEGKGGGVVRVIFPSEGGSGARAGGGGIFGRVLHVFRELRGFTTVIGFQPHFFGPSSARPPLSFTIPLNPSALDLDRESDTHAPLTIWRDTVRALNVSSAVPGPLLTELRSFLGIRGDRALGLFRLCEGTGEGGLREIHRNAPKKEEVGWQPVTGFQDAYPLHILNVASVREVERRMREGMEKEGDERMRLSIRRFRPNIIVSGPPAFTEDTWRRITINAARFDVSCRTGRCTLPNVDPDTGRKHKSEPDRTLQRTRAVEEPEEESAPGANQTKPKRKPLGFLGMQMVPLGVGEGPSASSESEDDDGGDGGGRGGYGSLTVGQEIVVEATGEHSYLRMFG